MPRLPGLDLLRSIAIVWVMLFHAFLVVGAALHHAVERPGLRLRDRLGELVSAGPQGRRVTG